jgi:hypothetical protein
VDVGQAVGEVGRRGELRGDDHRPADVDVAPALDGLDGGEALAKAEGQQVGGGDDELAGRFGEADLVVDADRQQAVAERHRELLARHRERRAALVDQDERAGLAVRVDVREVDLTQQRGDDQVGRVLVGDAELDAGDDEVEELDHLLDAQVGAEPSSEPDSWLTRRVQRDFFFGPSWTSISCW